MISKQSIMQDVMHWNKTNSNITTTEQCFKVVNNEIIKYLEYLDHFLCLEFGLNALRMEGDLCLHSPWWCCFFTGLLNADSFAWKEIYVCIVHWWCSFFAGLLNADSFTWKEIYVCIVHWWCSSFTGLLNADGKLVMITTIWWLKNSWRNFKK